jgi:hypothetical protein
MGLDRQLFLHLILRNFALNASPERKMNEGVNDVARTLGLVVTDALKFLRP